MSSVSPTMTNDVRQRGNSNNSAARQATTDSKADLMMELSYQNGGGRGSGEVTFNENGGDGMSLGKRTRLEKLLFAATFVLLLALAAVVVISVGTIVGSGQDGQKWNNLCNTPACVSAAHAIIQNMDQSVDPCEDFYQYACGGFDKRVRIPDDKQTRTQFALIDDELVEQLRDILESDVTEGESKVFRQARDQYKACMDLDKLEEIGLKPVTELLERFGGWPVLEDDWNESAFNWHQLVYDFRANGCSTDYLVDFSISTDIKNSTSRTIYISQASLALSREYLIKGFEHEDVGHYYSYMQKVAVLLGADPARAAAELKEALLFEIKLANASVPREEMRNASKLYNSMQLKELNKLAPIVPDWKTYVNNILTEKIIQVEDDEKVVVTTPSFLRNLTEILNSEPKRNVANYMLWRATRASIGFLNKASREISEEYVKNVTGKTAITPRWKRCVSSASGSFSAAVGKMYVLQHFQEDAKASMTYMVKDIKEEFRNILNEIDWMEDATKSRAHKKLDAIKDYVGYPKEILVDSNLEELYDGLEISSDQYLMNAVNMSIWSTNYHWKKLREKVDKTDWKRHADPAVVNAFYSSIENAIIFPAGILQGNFYGKDRPNYLNYGSIGWVIGHEITHGFDDQGRQYDDTGNLSDWWEEKTKDKFLSKTQCIIWQYSNYTAHAVNLTLDGINTQGENIADNGGLKEAYRGYKRWVKRNGQEKLLPGLNMNQLQLFWMSAANTWCSKYRPKALERYILTGQHSPSQFRVKGPFSNSKEFARDFDCPLRSPMNPIKKCEVW